MLGFASLNTAKLQKPEPSDPMPRRPRRTVHKLTRWHSDEWQRVADAARERGGVPPLRFVREAALAAADAGAAAPRPKPRQRRAGDELVHQLARVMNNLQQLQRVAQDDSDDDAARMIGAVLQTAEMATRTAPERESVAAAILADLHPAGVALNELAHRANATEGLPPEAELNAVLETLFAALARCLS